MGGRGGSGPSAASREKTNVVTLAPPGTHTQEGIVFPADLSRNLALMEIARRVGLADSAEQARETLGRFNLNTERLRDMAGLLEIKGVASMSKSDLSATIIRHLVSAKLGHGRLQA